MWVFHSNKWINYRKELQENPHMLKVIGNYCHHRNAVKCTKQNAKNLQLWKRLRAGTHTATSIVRKNVVRPPFHTRATKYISLLSVCRTVDVVCRDVWKLRLHFIFYYLTRHEPYGRRTTDVTVCAPAPKSAGKQNAIFVENVHVTARNKCRPMTDLEMAASILVCTCK
jgi:hypothetical protein